MKWRMAGEIRASSCLTQISGNTVQNLTMWLWRASKTPADALAAKLSETSMGSSLVSIVTLNKLQHVASSHEISEVYCRHCNMANWHQLTGCSNQSSSKWNPMQNFALDNEVCYIQSGAPTMHRCYVCKAAACQCFKTLTGVVPAMHWIRSQT